MLLHVSVTSKHLHADISVHGHDLFSAYSKGSYILYIYCVEIYEFRLSNCSIFWYLDERIIWNIYGPINVVLSRWCHWWLFRSLPSTEPCALGSTQPLKMSTRDFSWGKGGQCVWLTTYHPCSAERQENPIQPTRNPLGCLGLLRDNLYIYHCISTSPCTAREGSRKLRLPDYRTIGT